MNFCVSSRVRVAESPLREDFAVERGIFTGFSSLLVGSPDITEDYEFRPHGTGLAKGLIALFRSVDS